MTWNTIETAPKDGTPLLVCFGNYDIHPDMPPIVVQWHVSGWLGDRGKYYNPRYWMLLPKAPKENM